MKKPLAFRMLSFYAKETANVKGKFCAVNIWRKRTCEFQKQHFMYHNIRGGGIQ